MYQYTHVHKSSFDKGLWLGAVTITSMLFYTYLTPTLPKGKRVKHLFGDLI